MKYTLIAVYLFSICLFAQTKEKFDNTEVVFVVHSGKNGNYQSKRIMHEFKNKRATVIYNFYVVSESIINEKGTTISFIYDHYLNFDEQSLDNPVPYFKLNKSFLKKNKGVLITLDTMKELGYQETSKLIYKAKTIFLIDNSETNNGEIVIKEVRYDYPIEE